MKKATVLFILLILICNNLFAQPQTIWEKTFGGSKLEWGGSVITTSDGHWLFAAWSASPDGDVSGNTGVMDAWVFKTDTFGNLIWSKNFGGSGHEEGASIAENPDGTFWVVGETHSLDGIFASNKGLWDIYVLKLSASGDLLLSKTFGGTGADDIQNFAPTADGGLIFAASSWSNSGSGDVIFNHGERDCWLVKLNANAEMEWQKSIGGSKHDSGIIYNSKNGGFWLAAESRSNDGDFPMLDGTQDHWLVRLDDAGNIVWKQRLGLPDEIRGFQVEEDTDGNLSVMQRYTPGDRIEMAKYAPDGTLLVKTNLSPIFSAGSYWHAFSHAGADGFYLYAVDSTNTGYLTRTDANFQIIWSKEFPVSGVIIPTQVMPLTDNSLLVAGQRSPHTVITLDTDQDVQIWVAKLGGTSSSFDFSENSGLRIFPNPLPAGQALQILLENDFFGTVKFEILGLDGRVLHTFFEEKTGRRLNVGRVLNPSNVGGSAFYVRVSDGEKSAVRLVLRK